MICCFLFSLFSIAPRTPTTALQQGFLYIVSKDYMRRPNPESNSLPSISSLGSSSASLTGAGLPGSSNTDEADVSAQGGSASGADMRRTDALAAGGHGDAVDEPGNNAGAATKFIVEPFFSIGY